VRLGRGLAAGEAALMVPRFRVRVFEGPDPWFDVAGIGAPERLEGALVPEPQDHR